MKNKISRMKGFTLVELLIVIALIAILSVAVLATINPIEQTNKARDAQFKNDAAEVLSAYERYYASLNKYPWGVPSTIGETVYSSVDAPFGVTGANAELVVTSELKSSFAAKTPFIAGAALIDTMYTYNNGTDATYVCFVPKARANRTKLGDLRCITGAKLIQPGQTGCATISADDTAWSGSGAVYFGSGLAQFMCVPETATVTTSVGVPTVAPTPTGP